MRFLDARRIVAEFRGGPELGFLLGMSGTPEPLLLYVQAAAAERGLEARVSTLPFGALGQAIRAGPGGGREVFLLFPWDLCPDADWRSGVPAQPRGPDELRAGAVEVLHRLARRGGARLVYVTAPIPPLLADALQGQALAHRLAAEAAAAGALLLPGSAFSLESYYRSGFPLAADRLGDVARAVVAAAADPAAPRAKVLVTDFDNVLWAGVVGEDGVAGVHQQPDSVGYPHFLYQTFLRALKRAGVLLAGVTRNDRDLALGPLRGGAAVLTEEDFVAVVASYNPKSAQIAELAATLNLALDAFVFVDDNPVELAEVAAALPQLACVQFPQKAAALPDLLWSLSRRFHSESVTAEDASRTELYRRRLAGMAPVEADGADLTAFLAGLQMRITVHDRTTGERARALQLINKTNQFNLNAVRRSEEEVDALLAAGGRLLTATLEDRFGSHGEILALLMDAERVVRSFVLSCRVFQRRVEFAFLAWLVQALDPPVAFEYRATERNEPMRRFLADAAFRVDEERATATLDAQAFLEAHAWSLELFEVVDRARSEPPPAV